MGNNLYSFKEIQVRIGNYLDKAMTEEDQHSFSNELQQNDYVRQVFQRERDLRQYLKRCVHRPNVTPGMLKSIKDKLHL